MHVCLLIFYYLVHCLPVLDHQADSCLISVEGGKISSQMRDIVCWEGPYFYQMNPADKGGFVQKQRSPLKMTETLEWLRKIRLSRWEEKCIKCKVLLLSHQLHDGQSGNDLGWRCEIGVLWKQNNNNLSLHRSESLSLTSGNPVFLHRKMKELINCAIVHSISKFEVPTYGTLFLALNVFRRGWGIGGEVKSTCSYRGHEYDSLLLKTVHNHL